MKRVREKLSHLSKSSTTNKWGLTIETIGRSIERKEIAALAKLEIIQRHDQKNTFEFRRSSMREAIYSCIPEEELRRLHKTYAKILGASKSDIPPESLAYHYFKAQMFSESFSCSLESAKLASRANSLTEASRNLQRCMEILILIDDKKIKSEQLFNFYREMASSLGLEGRYKEVYPLYRRWRRLGKRLDNQEEVLYSVLETAQMLWRQTKYGRCRRVLSSVLGSKEIELDSSAYATACSTMADLQRRSGDFTSAREWCEKAIAIGSSSGDSKVLANSHNKLGLTLWGAGELELAASEFETSLKYGKENNGQYSRGRTINNLGIINFSLGHFIKAEKMLAEALQIFGDIGDTRNEAYASGNLANINRYIGRITRAKELFGRSDLIFERLNDSHAHFYTVGNLGDIELMLGNLVRAEENFKQSAEFAESVGDKELAAECGVRFGELSFFCGDMTTAEKRYGEAIELAKSIGSKEWVIRASIGMARLCIFQRKSEEAQRLISEIKELASAENAVIACNEAIYLSGEQFRISGDLESATKQYREVLGYARKESLFELTLKSAVRLYESDQFAREEAINILNETARQFIEQNSHDVWNQVLMSAYFSFFSSTLEKVFSDYHPASPKML